MTTTGDRWWIAGCAFGAAALTRVATGWPEVIFTAIWGSYLAGLALIEHRAESRRSAASKTAALVEAAHKPPTPPPPSPLDLVKGQLEAFAAAGLDEDQSKALIQEMLRTAVRVRGGWKP